MIPRCRSMRAFPLTCDFLERVTFIVAASAGARLDLDDCIPVPAPEDQYVDLATANHLGQLVKRKERYKHDRNDHGDDDDAFQAAVESRCALGQRESVPQAGRDLLQDMESNEHDCEQD